MKTLPQGYTWITPTTETITSFVQSTAPKPSPFELLASLPGFDPNRSARMIADNTGTPFAYAEVLRIDQPYPRAWLRSLVAAEHRGRGLGETLHTWMLEQIGGNSPGRPILLEQTVSSDDESSVVFLQAHNYEQAIDCVRMVGTLPLATDSPMLPEGVSISVEEPGQSHPFLRENIDILREHFGTTPVPDGNELRFPTHLSLKEPSFDPPWYVAAHTDDEVCGLCSCIPGSSLDPSCAVIPALSVRRIWRKQGIGYSLLHHMLHWLSEAGVQRVELLLDRQRDVDLRRLCESAGMSASGDFTVYRCQL